MLEKWVKKTARGIVCMMSRKVYHLDWSKKSEEDDGIVNIRKARSGVIGDEVGKAGNEGVAVALGTSNQAVCTLNKSLYSMCGAGAMTGLL